MIPMRQVFTFAFLHVLALFAKSATASFAYCVGVNGPLTLGREVVGFKLWNDRGEEPEQYRSIYFAKKTTMRNDGWSLDLKFDTPVYLTLRNISVSSDLYGNVGNVGFHHICGFKSKTLYYGCYSNDNSGFCERNEDAYMDYCYRRLPMGRDVSSEVYYG
ncbi:hypothetical protein BGZ80_004003 [Entomortierella chlamydospora]|uniref:Uncharacterized protein n=1 Tax=Entomortierella chlamydospora TaxID=101097 RepID=A0A9P6SW54_9FUNG|nr:hypothetical protein BGZ79_001028 [Entomortierella chlamydospora]KAG0007972.1 hypothetical protein BGZ80_004003 [Entomortierella chlamydospora]